LNYKEKDENKIFVHIMYNRFAINSGLIQRFI